MNRSLAFALSIACGLSAPAGAERYSANRVRRFTAERLDKRKNVSLAELFGPKDKAILVYYLSVHCVPCLKEIPIIETLAKDRQSGLSAVLVVANDATPGEVLRWKEAHDIRLPFLYDTDGTARDDLRIRGMPTLFVIDRQSRILFSAVGMQPQIERRIKKALELGLKEITILYTGYRRGVPPKRLAEYADRLREEHPNLLMIDAGNTIGADDDAALEALKSLHSRVGYDAFGVGVAEMAFGIERFQQFAESSEMPYVLSNAFYAGSPYLSADIRKEIGPFDYSIAGFLDPELLERRNTGTTANLAYKSVNAVKPLVKRLGKSGFLFMIVNVRTSELRRLVNQFPAVDVFLCGRPDRDNAAGRWMGGSIVVNAGPDEGNVGVLTLQLDEDQRISGYKNKLIDLNNKYLEARPP